MEQLTSLPLNPLSKIGGLHPKQLLPWDEDCSQLPDCAQELLTRVKVGSGQNHARDLSNSLTLQMGLGTSAQALRNSLP